jgi:hypothetical protein
VTGVIVEPGRYEDKGKEHTAPADQLGPPRVVQGSAGSQRGVLVRLERDDSLKDATLKLQPKIIKPLTKMIYCK